MKTPRSLRQILRINLLAFSALLALPASIVGAFESSAIADSDAQILSRATFYLFTNPKICMPCRVLEKKFQDSGQSDHLIVSDGGGKKYSVKMVRINPETKELTHDQIRALGYDFRGIPQYSIVLDGTVRSTGTLAPAPWPSKDRFLTDTFKIEFMPRRGESVEEYQARLEALEKTTNDMGVDFSSIIFSGLKIQRNRSLISNPNFRPPVAENNILLVATGSYPLENPIFNGQTLERVSNILANLGSRTPTILYGSGEGQGEDTYVSGANNDRGQEKIFKFPLAGAVSSTRENLNSFFEQTRRHHSKRNLTVLVGHGGREGFFTWADPAEPVSPEEMRHLHQVSGARDVLVSGNCHGGVMAHAMSCSFMAAAPSKNATGCSSFVAVSNSIATDYVSMFFESLRRNGLATSRPKNNLTFAGAHAYAMINGAPSDSPYTTLDAMVDEYFSKNPQDLPVMISAREIREKFFGFATFEEKKILSQLMIKNKVTPNDTLAFRSFDGVVDSRLLRAKFQYDIEDDQRRFQDVEIKDKSLIANQNYQTSNSQFSLSASTTSKRYLTLDINQYLYDVPTSLEGAATIAPRLEALAKKDPRLVSHFGVGEVIHYVGRLGSLSGEFLYMKPSGTVRITLDGVSRDQLIQSLKLPHGTSFDHLTVDSKGSAKMQFLSQVQVDFPGAKMIKSGFIVLQHAERFVAYPFPTILAQEKLRTITRRLLFRAAISRNSDGKWMSRMNEVQECENQLIEDFIH